jgi:hypothetical protein
VAGRDITGVPVREHAFGHGEHALGVEQVEVILVPAVQRRSQHADIDRDGEEEDGGRRIHVAWPKPLPKQPINL